MYLSNNNIIILSVFDNAKRAMHITYNKARCTFYSIARNVGIMKNDFSVKIRFIFEEMNE